MNIAKSAVLKCLGSLCLCIALMPGVLRAQAGQGGAGQGGAGQGGAGQGGAARPGMGALAQGPRQLQMVLDKLDLSADQKTKIDGLIKQAQTDTWALMQGVQDATPEERQQKRNDRLKIMTDTKTKVEAELTPEQKAKYYPLVANTGLKTMTEMVITMKTEAGKMDISDDLKKQVASTLDEAQKSLDGMKPDADAVKDADTAEDFQKNMAKAQMGTLKKLQDVLGQEDIKTLMQNTLQTMARTALRGGRNGAAEKDAATTQPAGK